MCVFVCVRTHTDYMWPHTHKYIHTCLCVYVCLYMCVYVYMCVHVYVRVCVSVCSLASQTLLYLDGKRGLVK